MAQAAQVPEVHKTLVRLVARAFCAGDPLAQEAEEFTPTGRKRHREDSTGLAIVVLDALTRHAWVAEEALAAELKIGSKVLRRVLRLLEARDQLVTREHRKQPRKRARTDGAAEEPSASISGEAVAETEGERSTLVVSFCCLDYARALDVITLRLHRMRRRIADKLETRKALQEYRCPHCHKVYTTLQVMSILRGDGFFCEDDGTELALVDAEAKSVRPGLDHKARRAALLALQAKMEEQLAPLSACLDTIGKRIKRGEAVPDCGTLTDWYVSQAKARAVATGKRPPRLSERSSEAAEIEIQVAGMSRDEGSAAEPRKELPPWLRSETYVLGAAATPSASFSLSMEGPSDDLRGTAGSGLPKQEEASQSDQKAGLSNGRVFRENGKATGGLLSAEPSEWVPVKHEAATAMEASAAAAEDEDEWEDA